MIPKIIHFCWLSDDPYPQSLVQCMDTWREVLPDYEFRKWDFKRFPKDKSLWVAQAFDHRKYAFAADYIRLYALYTEGGIYLDCDVEVIKSFDPLLGLPYFFGFENGSGNMEAAVMGSEAGNPIFGKMLEYYQGREFVNGDGSFEMLPLPKVMNKVLGAHYTFKPIETIADFDRDGGVISVLPFDYFSPIHLEHRGLEQTGRTMAIHRFAGTWQPARLTIKKRIKYLVGPKVTSWFIRTKRRLLRR